LERLSEALACPIALYTATSEREKASFHQINKNTGNRIKYRNVDADTGDEVESGDIIKGYQVGKSQHIEVNPEELEAIALEIKHTIETDEFVPKDEIDEQPTAVSWRIPSPEIAASRG
jgi:DNA end-binding protein Ku